MVTGQGKCIARFTQKLLKGIYVNGGYIIGISESNKNIGRGLQARFQINVKLRTS